MARARKKAFVSRALRPRAAGPPSRATMPSQSWVQSRFASHRILKSQVIPGCKRYVNAYGVAARGERGYKARRWRGRRTRGASGRIVSFAGTTPTPGPFSRSTPPSGGGRRRRDKARALIRPERRLPRSRAPDAGRKAETLGARSNEARTPHPRPLSKRESRESAIAGRRWPPASAPATPAIRAGGRRPQAASARWWRESSAKRSRRRKTASRSASPSSRPR